MKRGQKRITVTDKLSQETRGEQYWDNWAQRMAEKQRTCTCDRFGLPHRPDQCATEWAGE